VLRAALPGGMEPTRIRGLAKSKAAIPSDAPLAALTGSEAPGPGTIILNESQSAALAAIEPSIAGRKHQAFLLYGVTGSGKTEVYLRAVARALELGGQALLLVPEIVLSSQILTHCRRRFGDRVVIWHSALPAGARKEAWRRVRDGRAGMVVGARSAVFAPFQDLRLVIVDEEHESAYKQDEAPRYNGRDVAIYRAALSRATIVLGSATPSLESFQNALTGKYRLVELPARIDDRPRPTVDLIDLGERRGGGGTASRILSEPLVAAVQDRLDRGEQTILFLNRRGHSTMVRCGECGHVARCPHCDISLTWHSDRTELRCHYCSHRQNHFDVCPDCGGIRFLFKGAGTQKVEAEIARLLPSARHLRLDFDTTRRRGALENIVSEFRRGDADILLGTQMVARGLDFPNVTLVGVINADTQLNLPDFRSAERTFQLLTQVAGRAGRGQRPGHVLVQTFSPGHYAVDTSRRQDYRAFFDIEIQFRTEVGYPPLTRLVNFLFDGKEEEQVMKEADRLAEKIAAKIRADGLKVELLGPAPQSLSRLKGKYRWHLTLKSKDHRVLRTLGDLALVEMAPAGGVRLSVDVDPANLL
jgi:primosomal protein N' (replication factor Y) (superfamily II helicase)